MTRKGILFALTLLICTAGFAQVTDYPITAFGARTDATATEAVQQALDAAEAAGGGRVVVPEGTWTVGTVWLRSHVELHLEKGAVLKGSTHQADYNRNDAFGENFWVDGEEWSGAHLVIALNVEDIAITGEGVIDGSGSSFFGDCDEDSRFPWYKYGLKLHPTDRSWFRPGPMVAMFNCKRVRLEGITLKDTPCWTTHFRCCDGMEIRHVTIDADRTLANSDGFSIDCSRNITIEGCTIRTGDDGFALRASCRQPNHITDHPCENIRIIDCDVWTCCYGVRVGIGRGTVRNIEITDCRFHESNCGIGFTPAWVPGEKGVYIEDVRVSHCDILECARPVESDARTDDWRIRGITFEDCRFESLLPVAFTSTELQRPEDITFRRCSRKYLEALRVRHHMGWGGERSRKFIEGDPVTNLRLEDCIPSEAPAGLLLLTFEGRHFDEWLQAMPLLERYGAHATFFVSGPINGEAIRAMKQLHEAGHSVGLNGLAQKRADEEVAAKGADRFYKEEIELQLENCRVAYIPITSYAYPQRCHTDATDALFKQRSFAHVRGVQDGLGKLHTDDRAFYPTDGQSLPYRLDAVPAGKAYHTDIKDILSCLRRAAAQKEVFVIASHGISSDADGYDMQTAWLERILATAQSCGLRAAGFDELP